MLICSIFILEYGSLFYNADLHTRVFYLNIKIIYLSFTETIRVHHHLLYSSTCRPSTVFRQIITVLTPILKILVQCNRVSTRKSPRIAVQLRQPCPKRFSIWICPTKGSAAGRIQKSIRKPRGLGWAIRSRVALPSAEPSSFKDWAQAAMTVGTLAVQALPVALNFCRPINENCRPECSFYIVLFIINTRLVYSVVLQPATSCWKARCLNSQQLLDVLASDLW